MFHAITEFSKTTEIRYTCVNPHVQLHACTILYACYDYSCLHVVSVDVVCIVELFATRYCASSNKCN